MHLHDLKILQVLGPEIPHMRDASGGFSFYTGLRKGVRRLARIIASQEKE
jgi:hypothetical protein